MATVAFSPYIKEFSSSTEEAVNYHSLVNYDPESAQTSHERWRFLCKTAAITTVVAFMALSLFVAAITAEAMPLVALAVLVPGLPVSKGVFDHLWTKAMVNDRKANLAKNILEQKANLDKARLDSRLDKLGIQSPLEENQLKNLFARYLFLLENSQKIAGQARADYEKGLPENDFEGMERDVDLLRVADTNIENDDEVRALQVKAQMQVAYRNRMDMAALERLEAIKLLKIMQDPRSKNVEGLSQVVLLSPTHRLILGEAGDASNYTLVRRVDGSSSYTSQEILENNPEEIARHLYDLQKPASGWFR